MRLVPVVFNKNNKIQKLTSVTGVSHTLGTLHVTSFNPYSCLGRQVVITLILPAEDTGA